MFYVYAYLDPLVSGRYEYLGYRFEYLPIYIGKGKGKRKLDHLRKTSNKIFQNKIAYWKRHGIDPIIIDLHGDLSESDAWEIEKTLIKSIGRFDLGFGPLLNLTDGGEGPSNRTPHNKGIKGLYHTSEETKAKLKTILTGKPKPDGHGTKVSNALKGKPKSPEHRRKLSEANKGKVSPNKGKKDLHSSESLQRANEKRLKYWTEEKRKEIGDRYRGRKLSETHKQNLAAAMEKARKPHSEETKLKMSELRKKYWEDRKKNELSKREDSL
jgi:hypothetical protein